MELANSGQGPQKHRWVVAWIAIPSWSGLLALGVGAEVFYKLWPSFTSATTALITAVALIAIFPMAIVLLHARLALRRPGLEFLRRGIWTVVVFQAILALVITTQCMRLYSEFRNRQAAKTSAIGGNVVGDARR